MKRHIISAFVLLFCLLSFTACNQTSAKTTEKPSSEIKNETVIDNTSVKEEKEEIPPSTEKTDSFQNNTTDSRSTGHHPESHHHGNHHGDHH